MKVGGMGLAPQFDKFQGIGIGGHADALVFGSGAGSLFWELSDSNQEIKGYQTLIDANSLGVLTAPGWDCTSASVNME